jgi:hypothetical protein
LLLVSTPQIARPHNKTPNLQPRPLSPSSLAQAKLDIHDAMRLAANKNATKAKQVGCKAACQEWVGPMAMCKHKIPIFAQVCPWPVCGLSACKRRPTRVARCCRLRVC